MVPAGAAGVFFGLDLAWADHNYSGVAALDANGNLVDERRLLTDADILDWIDALLVPGPAVVAADIPLQVPNQEGARPCDRSLTSRYGARGAGPHPANRSLFMRRFGRIRGEDLAAELTARGFADPWRGSHRTVLEVYPHPGLIEVFGLGERLRYKRGRVDQRRRGLRRLRALLRQLEDADPPLRAPHQPIPTTATGAQLKAVEDALDARFCAWAALLWHLHPTRIAVYGDADSGHIAVAGTAAATDET